MTINVERDFELVVLEISGILDSTTAPNLDSTIVSLPEDTRELVFDMTELECISSAGIRVLIRAHKRFGCGCIRVMGASKLVSDVIRNSGLEDMFEV